MSYVCTLCKKIKRIHREGQRLIFGGLDLGGLSTSLAFLPAGVPEVPGARRR